jgi:hypothetical protein
MDLMADNGIGVVLATPTAAEGFTDGRPLQWVQPFHPTLQVREGARAVLRPGRTHRIDLRTTSGAAPLDLGATVGLASAPASAAVWSSCDQWGSTTLTGFTLYNDIWGSGAGSQCIWANSGTNWGVWANQIMLWVNKTGAVGPLGTSQGTLTLGDLQFGFEITSSSGGLDFTVNSESISSS